MSAPSSTSSSLSVDPILCIYAFTGGLVSFGVETRRLLHLPVGTATANLGFSHNDGVGCFRERQEFSARRLSIERDSEDRLRVSPVYASLRSDTFIEVAPTTRGRVTLRWGDSYLTASLTGEIALTPDLHPEHSCFWLLETGPAFEAPVSILRRGNGGEASADDFLPNLGFPQLERLLEDFIVGGLYGSALNLIFYIVDSHCFLPPFHGRSLFVPGLDRCLLRVSDALVGDMRPTFVPSVAGRRLIIASELYLSGGHSRVVEDLARLPGRTKIIVTDCFGNYAAGRFGLGFLTWRLPDVEIVFMRRATFERKARALLSAVAQHGPSEIYLFGHHQDPVPSAALASVEIPYRRIFMHHTDNNICLGATHPTSEHVNFTAYHARVVKAVRGIETSYLPLCVDDLGLKPGFDQVDEVRSTVTSGGQDKYTRWGALPYIDVVRTILATVRGDHFHIGPLPADWVDEIRRGLDEAGLDGTRFKHLGVVPSLWRALLDIDAQAYVASAPNGGGRAAVEAQGAGYPVLFYSNPVKPVLTQVDELNADESLGWRDTHALGRLLLAMGGDIPARSRRARRFYETSFSGEVFEDNVGRLGKGRPPAAGLE